MRYHFNITEDAYEVIDSDTGNIVCWCYTTEKAKLICDALNGVNEISFNSMLCEEKSFIHCDKCVSRSVCDDDKTCYWMPKE